ncbi:recombinase family protein [Tateyamaria sp. ANG-S1]|uniref:recombinase family protein n=1 Tax=Tateyamaria sp. ANG-S1 TaxID=1577905 RepID=UPI00068BA501|nr:recombinase family protein [Tateyamaria sp. ANG-S1]
MLTFCREGDAVVVHSLDRLGRDIRDLLNIVEELNAKGVAVEFLSERLKFSRDDDDPLARLQLHMLAAFAQWERNIAKARQAEGIARAKAQHPEKYQGRPVSIDAEQVNRLKEQGLGATAIAKKMRVGRASVYRHLRRAAAQAAQPKGR